MGPLSSPDPSYQTAQTTSDPRFFTFFLNAVMRQALRPLELKVAAQSESQRLPQQFLVAWPSVNEQKQVIAEAALRKHWHALAHYQPRAFGPPNLHEACVFGHRCVSRTSRCQGISPSIRGLPAIVALPLPSLTYGLAIFFQVGHVFLRQAMPLHEFRAVVMVIE